jgi:transposase
MQKLTTHDHRLLGLPITWSVDAVDFSFDGKRIEIHARFIGGAVVCSVCGLAAKVYDRAPEQRWRHFDTMQFETIIIARIPRCQWTECGVKTITLPWAERHSRFTLMFEGFAVELLPHCSNTNAAADMLESGWHATDEIMNRAVKRGLSRRAPEEICSLGIDEKNSRKGHKYITTLNDLKGSRVLDVVESRTLKTTETLLQTLTESQRNCVRLFLSTCGKRSQRRSRNVFLRQILCMTGFISAST